MKKYFRYFIKTFVKSKIGWNSAKLFLRFAELFRYEKSKVEIEKAESNLKKHFNTHTVEHGYFKGLKYPSFISFGSSLFPKLSGSYESELFPFFKEINTNRYANIIDVGCAEGFYAAGLALKYPLSKIYAFDIDERARKLCTDLCLLNSVADRVSVLGECTTEILKDLSNNSRNLIICDCEGFERHLFNEDNIDALSKSDLLIELHPMYELDVKDYLTNLFAKTHHVKFISSYDDYRKLFDLPIEYKNFAPIEKLKLVQEGRSFSMDWLVVISK